jgi:G3E family GTPase
VPRVDADYAHLQLVKERVRRSSIEAGGVRDSLALLDDSEVVELQNGCACCSASDELLTVQSP